MSDVRFRGKSLLRVPGTDGRLRFSPRGMEMLSVNASAMMRVEVWRYRGKTTWYGALYVAGNDVATSMEKTPEAAVRELEKRWDVIRADLAQAGVV